VEALSDPDPDPAPGSVPGPDVGGAQPRRRRARSATESLLSIVLGLEAILIFFAALAVFRFGTLPPAIAFGGGALLIVVLVLVGRLVRFSWGRWLGWLLQVLIVAIGFLVPLMFYIGAGFAAIWIYCFIVGRRLDRRNAAIQASTSTDSTNHKEQE
jgi:Protein of unknown function (DUF4233)